MARARNIKGTMATEEEEDGQAEGMNVEVLEGSRPTEVQRKRRSEKTLTANKGMNIRSLKWETANASLLAGLKSEGFL